MWLGFDGVDDIRELERVRWASIGVSWDVP
jgi:hypothetical protein